MRFPETEILFSSEAIGIGSSVSNPLYGLSSNGVWPSKWALQHRPGNLKYTFPRLHRLLTVDWFISLESFYFQWNLIKRDDKTLDMAEKTKNKTKTKESMIFEMF